MPNYLVVYQRAVWAVPNCLLSGHGPVYEMVEGKSASDVLEKKLKELEKISSSPAGRLGNFSFKNIRVYKLSEEPVEIFTGEITSNEVIKISS